MRYVLLGLLLVMLSVAMVAPVPEARAYPAYVCKEMHWVIAPDPWSWQCYWYTLRDQDSDDGECDLDIDCFWEYDIAWWAKYPTCTDEDMRVSRNAATAVQMKNEPSGGWGDPPDDVWTNNDALWEECLLPVCYYTDEYPKPDLTETIFYTITCHANCTDYPSGLYSESWGFTQLCASCGLES